MTVTSSFRLHVEQIPKRSDIALAGSLLGVAVLSGLFVDVARPDTVAPSTWWHWTLIATPPVLVALRRINPLLVTSLATVAQAAIWVSDLPEVLLSIIVILYSAASDAGRRGLQLAIGSSVVLTIVTAIGARIADDVTVYQVPLIVLTCGTAVTLGANAARQRQTARDLATEVAETRMRSEGERALAIADERSFIARELHDIIGHTLSVIAVRAEAADRVADRQPDAAHEAVTAIAGAARSALTETRRVLAGLRQSPEVDLAPPPDLAASRHLVSELAAAGVDVTITEEGCDERQPPAVIAGGAFRIVQESLTNAIRHGGPSVVINVALVCRSTELDLTITNTCPPGPRFGSSDGTITGSGRAAMAERAEVLGGTFTSGWRWNGDFAVNAVLPIDSKPLDSEPSAEPTRKVDP